MRKAYSYIRMSTDIQLKGDSLRRQLESSLEYAKLNNLELVDSINGTKLQDLGVSAFRGKNTSQGTLSIFLNFIEEGLVEPNSVLLVESLDRLSRNKIGDALTQFLLIINSGIEIITFADNQRYTKESINNNPAALYISVASMFRANEESEIKSKRIKAAWSNKRKQAVSQKKPMTKTTPSWIQMNDDRTSYILNKQKAKVVTEIFRLCASTTGIFGITRHLNETKTPTFNGSKYWHQSYVSKILNNRAVIGEYHPHHYIDGKRTKLDEPITGYFPAIISEEEFNLAHAAINLRTNNRGRKGSTFTNILSGLAYCQCGQKMSLTNKGNHKSNKRLICYSKLSKAGCENDDWVYEEALDLLFKHLKEVNFEDLLDTDSQTETGLQNNISSLEFLNSKLNMQINNIVDMVSNESLNQDSRNIFIRRMNEITKKVEDNAREIVSKKIELEQFLASKQALNHENVTVILDKLKETDDYMFRSSVNNLLSKFIEKIELIPSPIYAPWELDDDSAEVMEYKKTHPKLTLNEIVERETFQRLFRKMNRSMVVKFRFGASRLIQGDGLTYYNKPAFEK